MTNIGPLTTTFTAPASCTTATGLYQIWESNTYHFEQGPLASMTECFPSGYNPAATSQYYSPGVCPSGYTTACSSTNVLSASATETAFTCCPTGRVEYTCAADVATGSLHFGCTTVFENVIGIALLTAISSGSTYSTAVTASAGQGIGAHSIAVRLRAGDPTEEILLATATDTITSSTMSASSNSSSLSTIGMAGIGVGAAALVLAISGALVFFLWMRRRKQRDANTPPKPPRNSPPPSTAHSQRGPPSIGPLHYFGPPAQGPRVPPPSLDHYNAVHSVRTMSPAPSSTTSSAFNKAREVEFYKARNVEIRSKKQQRQRPPPPRSRDTSSTFSGSGGVSFADYGGDQEKTRAREKMHDMYELHASSSSEWGGPPSVATSRGALLAASSGMSFDTLLSGAEFKRGVSPPRAAYGGTQQQPPVELEESPPPPRKKGVEAAGRQRRILSARWGRGTSRAPAELPAPDMKGFVNI